LLLLLLLLLLPLLLRRRQRLLLLLECVSVQQRLFCRRLQSRTCKHGMQHVLLLR